MVLTVAGWNCPEVNAVPGPWLEQNSEVFVYLNCPASNSTTSMAGTNGGESSGRMLGKW